MNFQGLLEIAPSILFALTIHEYAHALIAYKQGDPTARDMGRLTFNPIAHLDPIGTFMLFLVHFGWGKPVPVNPSNLRDPKKDMMWISLSGPASNVLSAALLGIVFRILILLGLGVTPILKIISNTVLISLMLGFFNLLPIPPLDGSSILAGLLPLESERRYRQLERPLFLGLMGLILIGMLSQVSIIGMIIRPPVTLFYRIFMGF